MIQQHRGTGNIARRTDRACKRATRYLLCAALLATLPAVAATPEPIKLALFDFELQDFSAGPESTAETPADNKHLAQVTSEVRQLFAKSGRYSVIDASSADADPVKAHTLRECDGCDAGIALKLGADQSLVGVVSRISRTEYTVKFRIRDARTGAIIADEESELRMGADYSWSRGATRLVKDRLLERPAQQ
jgi:hypothetical protein